MSDLVGASPEVITHHVQQHRKVCPGTEGYQTVCPCGDTIALVCAACATPLFLAGDNTKPFCSHLVGAVGHD